MPGQRRSGRRGPGGGWEAGIRAFDTAPHYGVGLSEQRIGRFLAGRPREEFVVSTKVGRRLAREVGKEIEIHLDTGITSGADVVAAIALGARFTLVSRAYLYGLMAGGRAGVDRMIAILSSDIERTIRLLGATSLEELAPRHVTLSGH
jgi:isopentenyl diphosphate isomerase/L-lactate dehydrogenase-like FMN-dependent dehydrogenase